MCSVFLKHLFEEDLFQISNLQVPHVNRQEYTLLDINEDGYVSLQTGNSNVAGDLQAAILGLADHLEQNKTNASDEGLLSSSYYSQPELYI